MSEEVSIVPPLNMKRKFMSFISLNSIQLPSLLGPADTPNCKVTSRVTNKGKIGISGGTSRDSSPPLMVGTISAKQISTRLSTSSPSASEFGWSLSGVLVDRNENMHLIFDACMNVTVSFLLPTFSIVSGCDGTHPIFDPLSFDNYKTAKHMHYASCMCSHGITSRQSPASRLRSHVCCKSCHEHQLSPKTLYCSNIHSSSIV